MTVSHVRQRVSFVKMPEKRSWIQLWPDSVDEGLLKVMEEVGSVFAVEWIDDCDPSVDAFELYQLPADGFATNDRKRLT